MYKSVLTLVMLFLSKTSYANNGFHRNRVTQTIVSDCQACKGFVNSFKRGMERTENGKFDGGDAAWEEEKLGSYARSEIRLVEIQERLCAEIGDGQEQCYRLLEEYDMIIEDWWLNRQDEYPDIFMYFCVHKLKLCCPNEHYGPKCLPCPGFPKSVCFNNGDCKGAGTRRGNGKCICDKGYIGKLCDNCDEKYYETYRDHKKVLCSACPIYCEGPCTKAGCEKCAKGWLQIDKGACIDVNECVSLTAPCTASQFCVNTEGNFRCLDCDKACVGCTGDGPDMCLKCGIGYTLVGNMCIDDSQEGQKQYMYYARILTYIGLCIATCITYQKNVTVAAIIGLTVAIYITVSEYLLSSGTQANATDMAEKLLMQKN